MKGGNMSEEERIFRSNNGKAVTESQLVECVSGICFSLQYLADRVGALEIQLDENEKIKKEPCPDYWRKMYSPEEVSKYTGISLESLEKFMELRYAPHVTINNKKYFRPNIWNWLKKNAIIEYPGREFPEKYAEVPYVSFSEEEPHA
jgi:hypothetical protein